MVVGSSKLVVGKMQSSVGKVNTDLGKSATRSCRRSAAANGREDNNVCPLLNDSVEDTVLVVTITTNRS
jgi:hypothetical protein